MGQYWGDSGNLDKPKWRLISISKDGINVTWKEKYGELRVESCIGLWESDSQYKLTWKDAKTILLEKSNINGLTVDKYGVS